MRQCPNGHEVNDLVKYCPKCGAEIQEKTEVRFCKKCGYERKGSEKFCAHCGYPFNGVIESSSKGLTDIDNIRKTSNNRLLLFFLIVPAILFGGYWLYNYIEEEKKQVIIRIEERIKAEEKERKRIEEENQPAKRFYKLAKEGRWVWISTKGSILGLNINSGRRKVFLYFYPTDEMSGTVSILTRLDNAFLLYGGGRATYKVRKDNTIYFKLVIIPSWYEHSEEVYEFNLDIVNDGNNVKLVRYGGQEFRQEKIVIADPLKNDRPYI